MLQRCYNSNFAGQQTLLVSNITSKCKLTVDTGAAVNTLGIQAPNPHLHRAPLFSTSFSCSAFPRALVTACMMRLYSVVLLAGLAGQQVTV